jgi:hypothetical protein
MYWRRVADAVRWAFMRVLVLVLGLALISSSGCAEAKPSSATMSCLAPPREGEILVHVGGRATSRGEHWIPENANYLDIERLARVDPSPRNVSIISPDGERKQYRVGKMTREEKKRIMIHHGDRIFFAFDRCWS